MRRGNSVLKLNPEGRDVWRLTWDALLDSNSRKHSLTVKCRERGCGNTLARAGTTKYGPLFVSWWTVELPLGYGETYVDGRKLSRREELRFRELFLPIVKSSGAPIPDGRVDGTIALLALPPEMRQEYPALMVRCPDHGDATLERLDILDDLRSRRALRKVDPSYPLLDYVLPRHDESHPAKRSKHYRETRFWAPFALVPPGG